MTGGGQPTMLALPNWFTNNSTLTVTGFDYGLYTFELGNISVETGTLALARVDKYIDGVLGSDVATPGDNGNILNTSSPNHGPSFGDYSQYQLTQTLEEAAEVTYRLIYELGGSGGEDKGLEILWDVSTLEWMVINQANILPLPDWFIDGTSTLSIGVLEGNLDLDFTGLNTTNSVDRQNLIYDIMQEFDDGSVPVQIAVSERTGTSLQAQLYATSPAISQVPTSTYKIFYMLQAQGDAEDKGFEIRWDDVETKWLVMNQGSGSSSSSGSGSTTKLAFTSELHAAPSNGGGNVDEVTVSLTEPNPTYELKIFATVQEEGQKLVSFDITVPYNGDVFDTVIPGDIIISAAFPFANAVTIDNTNPSLPLIHITGGVSEGFTGVPGGAQYNIKTEIAKISLNINETQIGSLLPYNLQLSDVDLRHSADTIFIHTHAGGGEEYLHLSSTDIVNNTNSISLSTGAGVISFEGEGPILKSSLIIGGQQERFTNLVRFGDTLPINFDIKNTGNATLTNLQIETNPAFNDGVFQVEHVSELTPNETKTISLFFTIQRAPGNIIDLREAIQITEPISGTRWLNSNKGSQNLVTFKGDIAYNGRVGMLDLAYLNAAAALGAPVNHCDVNFDGTIGTGDFAGLEDDWGKSLHNSPILTASVLDQLRVQGNTTWNNDAFETQNALEQDTNYVGRGPNLDNSSPFAPVSSGYITNTTYQE